MPVYSISKSQYIEEVTDVFKMKNVHNVAGGGGGGGGGRAGWGGGLENRTTNVN